MMHSPAPPLTPRMASATPGPDEDLTWLPAWRLVQLIAAGTVSPVTVTEHFLARIAALDPHYHAFRMIDAEGARQQAKAAEHAVLAGAHLGPLHGVPIALKEHIAVKGLTWWDSWTATTLIAQQDSIEAERLRAAGAIIIGTTVAGLTTREFGDSDQQPHNPWDRTRVCGDSSSGSACAMATAMVPLVIAADGLGSTRLPAAFCGLVGIMPTRGRVASAHWTEMNSKLLSAISPLTRDVRDNALVLQVLAGPDGRDLMCRPDAAPDYLARIGQPVTGMKLIWTDDFGFTGTYAGPDAPRVMAHVRAAAMRLTTAGASIGELLHPIPDHGPAASVVMRADRTNAIRSEPAAAEITHARHQRRAIWDALSRELKQADFILSPTIQYIAPTRSQWAAAWADPAYMKTYSAHTGMANLLGWPALSVPAGLVDGLPVGLQILGKPDSEPAMYQLAQAFLALA